MGRQDRHLVRGAGLSLVAIAMAFGAIAARPAFQISNDRELKEIDLTGWDCLNRLEGTAKTPDGIERNRLKNRSAPEVIPRATELDTAGFLKQLADFEAQTKGKRRKDLNAAQMQQLEVLEKKAVQLTGYLVLAYCGPPETTNCGSVDFHDWHLEIFERPQDHAPQPGDPTPIVCEITPRTQNAIFRDNIRIQELAAFFRQADFEVASTGHPARHVRVTGYLLWDDEHNGSADVGTTIRTVGANKYHNPWRSAAWEIHPVVKIEPLDGAHAAASVPAAPAPPSPPPVINATPSPKPISSVPTPTSQQFATLLQPVKIKIPYGETVLPRGARLPIVSRDAQSVVVRYLDGNYAVPLTSTDLR